MEIKFRTDVGRRRNTNQDYADYFANQAGITLAILADGMGGHRAGDVASQLTVKNLGAAWEATDLTDQEKTAQWLLKTIQNENQMIYEKGQTEAELFGMGTTIVAVVIFADGFTIAHVGDSRAYLIRNSEMHQLTEDHSLVNELVKSGEITQEMAANHPRKNVLTRSIGMPGLVDIDMTSLDWLPNDYLLLCSDGLTNMLSDEEIKQILQSEQSLDAKINQLIDQANEAGGVDNITVLVIDFDEDQGETQ